LERRIIKKLKKMIWLVGLSIITVAADADAINILPAINNKGDIVKYIKISQLTYGLDKYDQI